METFSEKLQAVRKERDYTQDRLSKEMNVSRQTISHWENGRAIPDIDTIKRLSQVLDYNFLAIEGMTDEAQRAPAEAETPAQEADAPAVNAASGKRKLRLFVIGAALLCIVLLGVFFVGGSQPQSALKANVVLTPVENPVPVIVVEDFPEGYGWMFEVAIEETAGVPFTAATLTQTLVGEDGGEYPYSVSAEQIAMAWGSTTLCKDAPRNWRGGIPVQPVKAIKVSVRGTDANGNEVEAECVLELQQPTAE